jgi:hypothetical protein
MQGAEGVVTTLPLSLRHTDQESKLDETGMGGRATRGRLLVVSSASREPVRLGFGTGAQGLQCSSSIKEGQRTKGRKQFGNVESVGVLQAQSTQLCGKRGMAAEQSLVQQSQSGEGDNSSEIGMI